MNEEIVMRAFASCLLSVLLVAAIAASGQPMEEWLSASGAPASERELAISRVNDLIKSVPADGKADQRQLYKLFRRTHALYLKKYEAYGDFASIFSAGKYDCLTATALFSHLLTELDFSYEVIETNYHIFILVDTSEGRVLLETTDRLGGFITDPQAIASRIGDYRKNELASAPANNYRFHCNLFQAVRPEQLTGLLFFNQSVKAYNRGDWLSCSMALEQAYAHYATERCQELGDILVRTLMERKDVDLETRSACMAHIKSVVMHQAGAVASN